ncbi:Uncharacterised protein [Zhongshania aliphaticivorans]|uniref:SnoaL-like domain-containing protein n=1 Tax=Zhongshania aliphaticivorans TaxID=1470434 RepID=A0A5S9N6G4_9GAMM|nr:nuclear transport factor 2 family protein [Zhongshania aliphaticivorans]CAA0081094.1 Uncharacterised protein [Zhongshania aliphaticivorans]CAA0085140.1 Uncharacterised protein [Zhongshania aliphaticivorans]
MSDTEVKQLEEDNLAVTKELFARFGAGDVDGIVELLHDDAHIEFYGPSEIPYAGDYNGLEECRKFFTTVLSSVNIHVFDAEEFICENDKVIVVGSLRLTTKANGNEIKSPFVHVITCKDNKWIWFRDFMNTTVAYKAFSTNAA